MLLDLNFEISEDLKLILNSLKETLDSQWSTKKLRSVIEGNKEYVDQIWKEIIRLEILPYISNSSLKDVVILNELIGSRLLPGIVASSIIASRGIKDKDVLNKLYAGEVKIAISDSNMVPSGDQADLILINNKLIKRKECNSIITFNSLDNTMKISKVECNSNETIEVNNAEIALLLSSQMLGSGEEVLNMSVKYSKERIAFGKPIGSYQAIKHRVVNDAIDIELTRSIVLEASENIKYAWLAKDIANRKVPKVIMSGIQVHGGIGFTDDIDIHLHLRRALTLSKIYNERINISEFL
ncbi:acyl-CoA dehydrogenase [Sulfolobus sp. A20]|uniref:acyl-CoA dehydrogenase family protein n=1 Tax=Saccharolobus sp. A20 TaxID=1891280 RepID=UPI0008460306|nr:acyl-CoA dehydrogenase family protein [Sulfolobus sp. A20]TRM75276.1 acyl-CoA dehydrogenase [Sulfolobus sp. E5]TRM77108.1 acyl-CoA dehydrogenase [Sulfolobus sp. A20-N-F8]TRM78907.1 acyl-CoA dehydrogenase [Sulfolobus sp. B5]TRM80778.1 acyl-CoA dehydrogenase [Sulfolobus sp. D5]TRM86915.1 acyl-CoA dehydrogenase [Sulfolobus sp. C3]TRM88745.1 acyl-CoA dehydrogenase [Sulfolobus sp. E3]TRM93026.1 acyl-CoA dehydrogenase [Sulfolobus sp. A20-N-G8]TRM98295.1 acyl-CoA dehydrogenase [Sulfolobus sp. F